MKISARSQLGHLMQAWRDAADEWERLRSDAAAARCRVARSAFYMATLGYVPALKTGKPRRRKRGY